MHWDINNIYFSITNYSKYYQLQTFIFLLEKYCHLVLIIFEKIFVFSGPDYVFFNPLQGEIRATGFNDIVDKFYELLEVNKVCISLAGNLFIFAWLLNMLFPFKSPER